MFNLNINNSTLSSIWVALENTNEVVINSNNFLDIVNSFAKHGAWKVIKKAKSIVIAMGHRVINLIVKGKEEANLVLEVESFDLLQDFDIAS